MSSLNCHPSAVHDYPLSLAVVSPDEQIRNAAANALMRSGPVLVRQFSDYTASLEDAPRLLEQNFDAILIDLDHDCELALQLVERLCIDVRTIAMLFSSRVDSDLMIRGMRAGAREFFTLPFNPNEVEKALRSIGSHRQLPEDVPKSDSKLLTFFGAKGGTGVTTIATNFAVALAEESCQRTLLIDLNLQFGDAAMNLGIEPAFSTVNPLQASALLDGSLLASFLVRHPSGLSVLTCPSEAFSTTNVNLDVKSLLAVARKHFSYVVIDAGKKIDLRQLHLYERRSTAYLVTQVGIPELRNANRLINQFADESAPALEIVLNRYQSRFLGITEEHLTKAISRPIRWKVPNDFRAVKQMQTTGRPLIEVESSIASMIRDMARSACGAGTANSGNSRLINITNRLRSGWKALCRASIQDRTPDADTEGRIQPHPSHP